MARGKVFTGRAAHLRSFIKNALPLAAGLNGTTAPGSGGVNLSPEQMHMAAQQLAHVVQTTGWASLGLSAPPDLGSLKHPTNVNPEHLDGSGGTTIPLGSFTLPLHPHPDYDIDADEDVDEEEELSDQVYSDQDEYDHLRADVSADPRPHYPAQPPQQAATSQATGKKKSKKKKKVSIHIWIMDTHAHTDITLLLAADSNSSADQCYAAPFRNATGPTETATSANSLCRSRRSTAHQRPY